MRTILKVDVTSHRELGRCYYETNYKVTSDRPLTPKVLQTLRELGYLGYGQGFSYTPSAKEGNEYFVNVHTSVDSSD